MYQIVGLQGAEKRVVVATPKTAGEALNHFRAAQNHFAAVLIIAADGQEIDGFELNRQYQAEQRSSYE
jgi:hypothetical protein